MVEIQSVMTGSHAYKAGVRAGDKLIKINSQNIRDVLDYRFYMCEKKLELELERHDGERYTVKIKKDEYDDIGLEFETFLMDKQQRCANKCIFCFIDQNPHGMREGIYFKDDDTRLSFLFGNYVTLTNVPDEELHRLCRMHISPVNISVQVTDPELRCKMLGNRFAGKLLSQMQILYDGGLEMNAQIVLCRGVNDGKYLEKTLSDLERFIPKLTSIAVVPVGLTRFRNGLYPLEPFDKVSALEVIETIGKWGEKFMQKYGTRVVFASDEFYLKAGLELPEADFYEGYPQLENGVGMIRSMQTDVLDELEYIKETEGDFSAERSVSVATGVAAGEHISFLVEKIREVWYNIDCKVWVIRNDFYGENVTVSGLLTGGDIISQLKGKELGTHLYIPRCALRHEGDLFLDGVSLEDMERELGVKVIPTDSDTDFLYKITEE
jgi:putative radical SAM enzyme (TIGR03279 family)